MPSVSRTMDASCDEMFGVLSDYDGYAEWARTIEECEDLWAVAGLRKDGAESPARISRRAA